MDANLAMQNNASEEEPASYFQRCYGETRIHASKLETAYCLLIECGATLSMDDFMKACNIAKLGHGVDKCTIHSIKSCKKMCPNVKCTVDDCPFVYDENVTCPL